MRPLLFASLFLALTLSGCGSSNQVVQQGVKSLPPTTNGIAIMLALDVSPSMRDAVAGEAKILSAQRCAKSVVNKVVQFASKSKDPVIFGMCLFSGGPEICIPLGPIDQKTAFAAIDNVSFGSSTAIGEAILLCKTTLNEKRFSRTYIVVVTDGENNMGADPAYVVDQINKTEQPTPVYLIGFDVNIQGFAAVKSVGGIVLPANNAVELDQTMSDLLEKKILLEKPE